ncbi:hydrogenase metallocenter (NiFe) assembly protein HypF [Photobacterium marinum]|uniref:Carbamoyltransferase HypF n=1 Tax=Photobacterium marinum TaxID=1056511 RepID=L8JBR7_9GAMM|nr:carbamoyltransferase HypF [Photobacterium marinum]ELR66241.1 hydrogenase metallocenter (NiFe) assembly protein HypF [Photobacterium marinum]
MKIHQQLRVNGVVQGVGFRPFVHKIALENNLKGWVLNDSQGVLIELQGTQEQYERFKSQLKNDLPAMAEITYLKEFSVESGDEFSEFEIRQSNSNLDNITIVPSDADVCEDCLNELFDENDRRYNYPFINCTNCGPRFSIIHDMPYDRKQTTMSKFPMCPDCYTEYTDISDRRYHAQPNACPTCGPSVWMSLNDGEAISTEDPIAYCRDMLVAGKIIAVKSVGGFHLAVNAADEDAVNTLRQRKKRDNKPFALMAKNLNRVRDFCHVSQKEQEYLQSVKKPIVVLKKRSDCRLPDVIAPSNPSLGIMLPSAPLHHLLLQDERIPALIMTSANTSGQPIVYENDRALDELKHIADGYLLHNRDIYTRVDDSLLKVVKTRCGDDLVTLIRRSRGFAPAPIMSNKSLRKIIASGAELKTTLALTKNNNVYLSQHIGDLKNDHTYEAHSQCAQKLTGLFEIKPEAWAVDLHPHFRMTRTIESQSELPVIKVQHHHAHMASCMGENNLEGSTIGVIFDGTGYGTDGSIWGGEFLLGDYNSFERAASIKSFNLLGGDKAVKEPYRVALSLLYETFGEECKQLQLPCFSFLSDQDVHVLVRMAERKINSFTTTSMGRLFDGISALLNLRTVIEYEAQAAIELEGVLERTLDMAEPYSYEINDSEGIHQFDYRPMIKELVSDVISNHVSTAIISRRFHSTIVMAVCEMCELLAKEHATRQVVLSGGVFMNEFILANTYTELKHRDLNVYVQQKVPSNDGGISLGQAFVANAKMESK